MTGHIKFKEFATDYDYKYVYPQNKMPKAPSCSEQRSQELEVKAALRSENDSRLIDLPQEIEGDAETINVVFSKKLPYSTSYRASGDSFPELHIRQISSEPEVNICGMRIDPCTEGYLIEIDGEKHGEPVCALDNSLDLSQKIGQDVIEGFASAQPFMQHNTIAGSPLTSKFFTFKGVHTPYELEFTFEPHPSSTDKVKLLTLDDGKVLSMDLAAAACPIRLDGECIKGANFKINFDEDLNKLYIFPKCPNYPFTIGNFDFFPCDGTHPFIMENAMLPRVECPTQGLQIKLRQNATLEQLWTLDPKEAPGPIFRSYILMCGDMDEDSCHPNNCESFCRSNIEGAQSQQGGLLIVPGPDRNGLYYNNPNGSLSMKELQSLNALNETSVVTDIQKLVCSKNSATIVGLANAKSHIFFKKAHYINNPFIFLEQTEVDLNNEKSCRNFDACNVYKLYHTKNEDGVHFNELELLLSMTNCTQDFKETLLDFVDICA